MSHTGTAPDERELWRIWWLWGMPVAWATIVLVVLAEYLRIEGHARWGDVVDIARLLLYWWWLRMAWRSAGTARRRVWTWAAKLALSAGLLLQALI